MSPSIISQQPAHTPPTTPKRDEGAVALPVQASKLFGCTRAAVADVLDRAADIISRYGLRQGDSSDSSEEAPACTVSAIGEAAGHHGGLVEAGFVTFAGYLRLTHDPDREVAALVRWNDTAGRTAAEVCGAMRACAAGLRITADASGYHTTITGVAA